ncbi:MAG: hypothetical protein ACHQO8_10655, partial [Vicinamibacterales bacterium]
MSITVRLGPTSMARANFIAEATLPFAMDVSGEWTIVDAADGAVAPAQIDNIGGKPRVRWHVVALAAGEQRSYELRPADAAEDAKRGIVLDDQPENGRVVTYYGGLLQT